MSDLIVGWLIGVGCGAAIIAAPSLVRALIRALVHAGRISPNAARRGWRPPHVPPRPLPTRRKD